MREYKLNARMFFFKKTENKLKTILKDSMKTYLQNRATQYELGHVE
jgi:hypothetical protein